MNNNFNNAEFEREQLPNDQRKTISLIVERRSLAEITAKMGLTLQTIEHLIHSANFAVGANDDLFDDYLALLDEGQFEESYDAEIDLQARATSEDASSSSMPSIGIKSDLAELETKWSPNEMRELSGSLLRLAESLDQDCSPDDNKLSYRWPSTAAKIEKNSLELAKKATLLNKQSHVIHSSLPDLITGDPAWKILLELFVQFAGGAKVTGKSLCISAECPATTALRHITRLEEAELIERSPCGRDGRVTMFELTKAGIVTVGRILERL